MWMHRKPDAAEVNPEERDARTVVCMQLASRIRNEDLEEFFSSVGKVTIASCLHDTRFRNRRHKSTSFFWRLFLVCALMQISDRIPLVSDSGTNFNTVLFQARKWRARDWNDDLWLVDDNCWRFHVLWFHQKWVHLCQTKTKWSPAHSRHITKCISPVKMLCLLW